MAARVAADLATRSGGDYRYVWITMGANDFGAVLTDETAWKANMGGTLDAIHAAMPNALIYVAHPWCRGYDSQSASISAWVDTLVAARSPWAIAGPDESTYLKDGDNGTALTSDGCHPNSGGYAAGAAAWQSAMGR